MWGQSKIVVVERRLSESLEQGLVMAPPRARMTNDRSTGVAGKVKLAGIGTGRRLLENNLLDAAYNADCAVKYKIWMRFGCETMANAAEASASTARPRKKKAAQGKHQQQEGTEPTRGLSKDEKESPADAPITNQWQGPWSTVPAAVPTVSY